MNTETEYMNPEFEPKQLCVTVKVWVWALDEAHAKQIVVEDMNYLCGLDTPIAGFDVGEAVEDQEP